MKTRSPASPAITSIELALGLPNELDGMRLTLEVASKKVLDCMTSIELTLLIESSIQPKAPIIDGRS